MTRAMTKGTKRKRAHAKPAVRCAIYTRKSSNEGLEQDFNSLDAQREACEAFVLSQKHEGWIALPEMYDDGGISGGTIDRPALKRLLTDIEAHRVDAVVIYKVDRLTRALSDFAKIVEVFDKHGVSFVSVTQQFNTTTSMGRLTLNMLLSFAQFEREVTGERIRDKIAASKKKGMWMGGNPPLKTVRHIFRRYLEVGSVRLLKDQLDAEGIVSKVRRASDGSTYGGKPLARGALYLMLQNRIYRGEIVHKDKSYPGLHEAIVDQKLWDEVQAVLAGNRVAREAGIDATQPGLLAGLLHDAWGQPMTPTHAIKKRKRYRYYVSRPLIAGRAGEICGQRLPAASLEPLIIERIGVLLVDPGALLDALQGHLESAPMQRQLVDRAGQMAKSLPGLSRRRWRNRCRGSPDKTSGSSSYASRRVFRFTITALRSPWIRPNC
jgi:DNA invertase Pin-like site-specific DNA recombinase